MGHLNGGNLGVEEALREHGGGMGQGVVVGLLPAKIRGRWPFRLFGLGGDGDGESGGMQRESHRATSALALR